MDTFAGLAPKHPFGAAPARRPGSIRRTSTVDTDWPQGHEGDMRLAGRARDLYTPPPGGAQRAQVVGEGRADTLMSMARQILSIDCEPLHPHIGALVGVRGGGHLRLALTERLPDLVAAATPLHQLLDDLAGASLVAGWAWSRWIDNWAEIIINSTRKATAGRNGQMGGICAGFRPGSSALLPDGSANPAIQSATPVGALARADDPLGWHALPEQQGVGMRRARRLDLWLDGVLHIDVGFQDSATSKQGQRMAVHEYHVTASADPATMTLLSISATPHILPYRECPAAADNVQRMVGQDLASFRQSVIDTLPGALGCTHLNDVLRSLADVPRLFEALQTQVAAAAYP